MTETDTRKVGERGQVTLPKRIRERENIAGGDLVEVKIEDGKIVIQKPADRDKLKEGYEEMAERDREISEEMLEASETALE